MPLKPENCRIIPQRRKSWQFADNGGRIKRSAKHCIVIVNICSIIVAQNVTLHLVLVLD